MLHRSKPLHDKYAWFRLAPPDEDSKLLLASFATLMEQEGANVEDTGCVTSVHTPSYR